MKETSKGLMGIACRSLSGVSLGRLLEAVLAAGSIATAARFGIRNPRRTTDFAVIVTSTACLAPHMTFKARPQAPPPISRSLYKVTPSDLTVLYLSRAARAIYQVLLRDQWCSR